VLRVSPVSKGPPRKPQHARTAATPENGTTGFTPSPAGSARHAGSGRKRDLQAEVERLRVTARRLRIEELELTADYLARKAEEKNASERNERNFATQR
jgi:hypothetical protein